MPRKVKHQTSDRLIRHPVLRCQKCFVYQISRFLILSGKYKFPHFR